MTSKKKAAARSKKFVKSATKKVPKDEDIKRPRIGVLIADDHSVVREGLASLIGRKTDMTVLAEAANGREAVELWKQHHPDVILLDLRMPDLDGVGAIKEIREHDEHARIIVLTTFDGDEDIYRAIQAGAKGYLLKDVPREALMDCIRRVHAGETCVPVHLAAKLAADAPADGYTLLFMSVAHIMSKPVYKNLGYDITSLDLGSGELRLIEVKGLGAASGTILLTPNERRVAEDRRDCYWLYVVTDCDHRPELQEPIPDPARLNWHEVTKVEHYYLSVDAMTRPMQVREDPRGYGDRRGCQGDVDHA